MSIEIARIAERDFFIRFACVQDRKKNERDVRRAARLATDPLMICASRASSNFRSNFLALSADLRLGAQSSGSEASFLICLRLQKAMVAFMDLATTLLLVLSMQYAQV